jgi:heme-degrading monooxygenase HmoA
MYMAMNRFHIAPDFEAGFEELWRKRESRLDAVSGFREFHLLRGSTDEDYTLYASHTVWESGAPIWHIRASKGSTRCCRRWITGPRPS